MNILIISMHLLALMRKIIPFLVDNVDNLTL